MRKKKRVDSEAKDEGFTLIETLLVLSVLSLILVMVPAIRFDYLTEKSETSLFFNSLQSSVTLVQNYSVLNDEWTVVRFFPEQGLISFRVAGKTNHPVEHRIELPDHVQILNNNVEFRFKNESGNIGQYETIRFKTPEGIVEYVFQLGSGRFVVKQVKTN